MTSKMHAADELNPTVSEIMQWCDSDLSQTITLQEMHACIDIRCPKDQRVEAHKMFNKFWPMISGRDGVASRDELKMLFAFAQMGVKSKK